MPEKHDFPFVVLDPALQKDQKDKASGTVQGLVWAICGVPGEGIRPLHSTEVDAILAAPCDDAATRRLMGNGAWVWLHFDTVHSATRTLLTHLPGMPEEVGATLVEADYGIALEAEDGTVWGSLPAFDDALAEEDREICTWRFAMREPLLITTRRNPIPLLGAAYRSLNADNIPRNAAGVVDMILRDFTATVRRQLAQLDDELDRAEDGLLSTHNPDLGHLGAIVGRVRRRTTELRRVIVPIDRVLHDEDLELPEWAEDELRDPGKRQVHAALDDLIALQDRARSLQDELVSNQAEETNRRLYILSVGTILMLPATIVTGFFGMNTGGMFLAKGGWGTLEAGGICTLFMVLTFIFMKIARLL
ncbi:CorA family divalent cation transporter [Oecophyllibacter saccharovorans]|uniref:Magnesium transporter n=1 Tax=Oecophyllibacter saccharovorans TaxID=2558360 RepID=A0A506UKW5_9PROT|nr:CorA family divalent cation transporter [Oecophyllibacter saccharovorans]QDH15167.1 magnesium transporter [Oecophyllibacter saccharovorans]TPW33728.1 magnesium transporter [Oecophyllibacter saccharovorans]TPW34004.1 magnesium transporter [Oecophyllibacter saccharovorans]